MACLQLSQTLADSFNALADEVQTLADRKTVLEHKLRFAHEQVRFPSVKHTGPLSSSPFALYKTLPFPRLEIRPLLLPWQT
jgi:hypothetical protein